MLTVEQRKDACERVIAGRKFARISTGAANRGRGRAPYRTGSSASRFRALAYDALIALAVLGTGWVLVAAFMPGVGK